MRDLVCFRSLDQLGRLLVNTAWMVRAGQFVTIELADSLPG